MSRPLVRPELVGGLAGVGAESRTLDSGKEEDVSVAALAEDALILGQVLAVLEPGHLGLGGGVDDANDLRLVVLPGVDEGLLLFDPGRVWKVLRRKEQCHLVKLSFCQIEN